MSKKFTCIDGSIIEVKSSKAWAFSAQCCQCRFVFEMDTLELDFILEVCQFHKNSNDIVNDVFNQVKAFNYKFGISHIPTDSEKSQISIDKKTEYDRIITLGKPEIRADKDNKTTIEQNLRSKGR